MTDPLRSFDEPDPAWREPGRDRRRAMARWVVVVGFVLAGAVLLGLIVLLHLSGAIGPGSH
ncbi:MAG TPA: hypothetical protein VF129_05830 [Actinomycetota bacterium]